MSEIHQEAEIATPGGFKFRAQGTNLMMAIVVALAALAAYMMYEHRMEAHASGAQIVNALRELATSQREQTCIMSMPAEKREQEFMSPNGFCRRITRAQ